MQSSPDAELCYRARYTHIGKLHKLPQRRSVMRRAVMTGTRRSEIARSGRPQRKLSKEAATSSTCTVSCSRAARQAALKELHLAALLKGAQAVVFGSAILRLTAVHAGLNCSAFPA